jgi:putative GTP pyrophosphokinase
VAGISKTQVDRLGDRLKHDRVDAADLRLLDEYRRSFGDAYSAVVSTIRQQLALDPTGRRAKSTGAIVDKLRRESIRSSEQPHDLSHRL